MKAKVFTQVLKTTYKISPYGKTLDSEDLATLWLTLPQVVKESVTDQMWGYAANQYLMDPKPSKDLAVHISMLKYLFRNENGMPNYSWGIKEDIEHRMKNGHRFNPQATSPYLEGKDLKKEPRLSGAGVLAQLEGKK